MTTYLTNEIWANINEDYQISNLGNVRSYKNGIEKELKCWIQNTGYKTVSINNKKYSVHRLVAETFIHKEKGKNVVNHKDGNKLNNNVNNLEWCTTKENIQHAYRTGLMDNAIKKISLMKVRAKNICQYDKKGNYIKTYKGSIEAEKELIKNGIKVNSRNIRKVCEGSRKTAGGYVWKYSKSKMEEE